MMDIINGIDEIIIYIAKYYIFLTIYRKY